MVGEKTNYQIVFWSVLSHAALGLKEFSVGPFLSWDLAMLFASLATGNVSGGLADWENSFRKSVAAAVFKSLPLLTAM